MHELRMVDQMSLGKAVTGGASRSVMGNSTVPSLLMNSMPVITKRWGQDSERGRHRPKDIWQLGSGTRIHRSVAGSCLSWPG